MAKGKKPRPPSYYKHREQNPNVSFCLNRELKELMDKDRGERSYGEYVKEVIQHGFSEVERLRKEIDTLKISAAVSELVKEERDKIKEGKEESERKVKVLADELRKRGAGIFDLVDIVTSCENRTPPKV